MGIRYEIPELDDEHKTNSQSNRSRKKALFFRWLATPRKHRIPETIKEARLRLNISHVTAGKWHNEYKASKAIMEQKSSVTIDPSEVTSILARRLDSLKPVIAENTVADDPKTELQEIVQLGLWLNLNNTISKLGTLINDVTDIDKLMRLTKEFVSILKNVGDLANEIAITEAPKIQNNTVVGMVQQVMSGLKLPSNESVAPKQISKPKLVNKKPEVVDTQVIDVGSDPVVGIDTDIDFSNVGDVGIV